jgi:hypothetical protein
MLTQVHSYQNSSNCALKYGDLIAGKLDFIKLLFKNHALQEYSVTWRLFYSIFPSFSFMHIYILRNTKYLIIW